MIGDVNAKAPLYAVAFGRRDFLEAAGATATACQIVTFILVLILVLILVFSR